MTYAERDEVQKQRPKMNYVGYSDKTWTTVEVNDRFAGTWQWGAGPYYDWCDDCCTDDYNIVKYNRNTIHGRFRSAKDAVMFKLVWS